VEDVHKKRSYDLYCERSGLKRHVEVKGTTGDGTKVLLTRGEVAHSRAHSREMVLFIVSGIKIANPLGRVPTATGGKTRMIHPWQADEADLKPVGFEYSLPGKQRAT
jgi:hypothetical protein